MKTVNLLAYAFQGSNPCPTTNNKKSPLKRGFSFSANTRRPLDFYPLNHIY